MKYNYILLTVILYSVQIRFTMEYNRGGEPFPIKGYFTFPIYFAGNTKLPS